MKAFLAQRMLVFDTKTVQYNLSGEALFRLEQLHFATLQLKEKHSATNVFLFIESYTRMQCSLEEMNRRWVHKKNLDEEQKEKMRETFKLDWDRISNKILSLYMQFSSLFDK